jgi:hypothetical protein
MPCVGLLPAAAQPSRLDAMRFSALQAGSALPEDFKPWRFDDRPRATRYSLVMDKGVVVLKADAQASTSGIVRELKVDPRAWPVLSWRWKVMNLIEKANIATREGDDFPARVYVTFDLDPAALTAGERMKLSLARMIYGERVPAAALCYVWDGKAPRETLVANAYTERVRMIVAESGPARVGQWVSSRRNVRDDYRRAFGSEPAGITGVIVSTDTDNTAESAVAFYGDLWFGPA